MALWVVQATLTLFDLPAASLCSHPASSAWSSQWSCEVDRSLETEESMPGGSEVHSFTQPPILVGAAVWKVLGSVHDRTQPHLRDATDCPDGK